MSNRNDDSAAFLVVIAIIAVYVVVYQFVKSVGETIGLPPGPTAWILLGVTCLIGSLLYAWARGHRVGNWTLWLVAGTFVFFIPALDYWSLDTVSKMAVDSSWEHRELTHAWYGTKWAQAIMFLSLFGIAAFAQYRDSD
ncbi:hypothetical protein [Janthinobacterium sp. UMAB-56]|uniref:hypothetical protein n=1 Tax=Janthinobacterium sp. UMAB-56 TaxID=1365361 RepID=UPI001C58D292|nr:hypothetical protein [Janthinobacterium sp. UMAB-56]